MLDPDLGGCFNHFRTTPHAIVLGRHAIRMFPTHNLDPNHIRPAGLQHQISTYQAAKAPEAIEQATPT
jgi:hypothetical protein